MKYYAKVDDQNFEIVIGDGEILVNGERYGVDFQELPEAGMVSLIINYRSLEAVVEEQEDSISSVLIRGELYEVQVQDERAYRLAQARGTMKEITGDAVIKSPMPGIIIAVPVQVGDAVQKEDKIVILESMKMENELRSPIDGIVTKVEVTPGAGVEKNQVLVVIGPVEDGA